MVIRESFNSHEGKAMMLQRQRSVGDCKRGLWGESFRHFLSDPIGIQS